MSNSDGATAAPTAVTRLWSNRRNLVSLGIGLVVLLSAFLAFSNNRADTAASPALTESSTSLAVATGDLVEQTVANDMANRATGGYVPGVGMVVTAEIPELAVTDIETWASQILVEAGTASQQLPPGEQIVFLLDIAAPTRISRLISFDPTELTDAGQMVRRDAPAVSTAPLQPVFETQPGE